MTVSIKRSKSGPYYEMEIDGEFAGNYDTVKEAADDFEEMKRKEESEDE